ncbi:hypothetical protein [Streptomyces varsoviensis]|uniref:PE-PGRS family protein n=1 Tax=Streptomyces varsoviensis TaxID=67373 RepID=A0ABR5JDK9_9ACTN|nr:hypothetical protein [Streptomyces varsoviensis]KOG91533.1 hypothetical protein ADK38_02640 [Streptomyces varsoviensis]
MEAGHGLRALRATVFAAVCVLLAALGHAVMSGTAVPWWAIGGALSGTGGAAWFMAGRERGPLLVTLATVGAQSGLHSFFEIAQNVARTSAAAGLQHAAGMGHSMAAGDGGMAAMNAAGMPGMSGMAGTSGGMSVQAGAHNMGHMAHMGHGALGMWSAHVLVALVSAMWLCGGEQAAFRLGRALTARLFAPLFILFHDAPATRPAPRIRRADGERARAAQRLRQLLYAHVLATRGPPARAAVV